MSRGLTHILRLLTLMAPAGAFAIGLGDIHVLSALNEPLSAQIDIVSATPEELQELNAAVASRETFQRYGAERPTFLASAHFRVSEDSHGRPVLEVSSSEAFTEPVVSLLVDLRWHKGELIREYPLLLDPADFASAVPLASPKLAAATSTMPRSSAAGAAVSARSSSSRPVENRAAAVAAAGAITDIANQPPPTPPADAGASPQLYKVSARDTLRGIVRRVSGSRSRSTLQRTMIAILRANPSAFDGNINRLHRSATLKIPTAEEIERIPASEARAAVRAQMLAWRRKDLSASAQPALAAATPIVPSATASPAAADVSSVAGAPAHPSHPLSPASPSPSRSADAAAANTAALAEVAPSIRAATAALAGGTPPSSPPASNDALERRIDSLEQALNDTKRLLSSEHQTLQSLQQYVAESASPYPVPPPSPPITHDKIATDNSEATEPRSSTGTVLGLVGGAAFIVLLIVWRSRAKRAPIPAKFPSVPQDTLTTTLAPLPSVLDVKSSGAPIPSAAIALRQAASPPLAKPAAKPAAQPPRKAPPRAPAVPAASAAPPVSAQRAVESNEQDEEEDEDTTVSVAVGSEMGDTTVNLAGPTERLAVDTARLAALNELERELERSYDPTETGVIDPSYAPGSATTSITTTQRLAHTAGAHAGGTHSTGATAQHVQMPSKLTERAVVEQERMNIVEILRKAIEQDPHRLDLRLKLLELYFSSGLSNREEFVEVARKLSRSGEVLSAADWHKIAALGSPAAANAGPDDKTSGKLADCA